MSFCSNYNHPDPITTLHDLYGSCLHKCIRWEST